MEMDFLNSECLLGQLLPKLDLYFNEGSTGNLAMTTT